MDQSTAPIRFAFGPRFFVVLAFLLLFVLNTLTGPGWPPPVAITPEQVGYNIGQYLIPPVLLLGVMLGAAWSWRRLRRT